MGSLRHRSQDVQGFAGEAAVNAVVGEGGGWKGGRRDLRGLNLESETRLAALLCAVKGVDERAVGEIYDEARSSGVLESV